MQQFDVSARPFDLLSLRSSRCDARLAYDATSQSEPFRIALTFFGFLFALTLPPLIQERGSTHVLAPTLLKPHPISPKMAASMDGPRPKMGQSKDGRLHSHTSWSEWRSRREAW